MQARSFLHWNRQNHHGLVGLRAHPPENNLTKPTPTSLQLELGDPTLEYDVLDKVDLLGCTKSDPEDQLKVRKILREYA